MDTIGKVWNSSNDQIILTAWSAHRPNQNEILYLTSSRVLYSSAAIERWPTFKGLSMTPCLAVDRW